VLVEDLLVAREVNISLPLRLRQRRHTPRLHVLYLLEQRLILLLESALDLFQLLLCAEALGHLLDGDDALGVHLLRRLVPLVPLIVLLVRLVQPCCDLRLHVRQLHSGGACIHAGGQRVNRALRRLCLELDFAVIYL